MKRFLPLLLLLFSSASMAEPGSYQVEIIVFRNLSATPEFDAVEVLRSFSRFPDVVDIGQSHDPTGQAADSQNEASTLQVGQVTGGGLPDDVEIVTQKSSEMDNAWRRLRSSQEYRPLIYAAWRQNRVDYYPPMRIHDQQAVATRLNPPTRIMVADLTAADPLGAYRSTFYQLDGSLQLRRSRFLHLYLDLEFRERYPPAGLDDGIVNAAGARLEIEGAVTGNNAFGVYALRQNRQVSTGEMQYFDTPAYGALVYVSNTP